MTDHSRRDELTKTPWKKAKIPHFVIGCDGEQIAHISCGRFRTDAQANAITDLIASAPSTAAERDRLKEVNAELVKALKEILISLLSEKMGEDWISPESLRRSRRQVSAAIAKATEGGE